MKTPEQKAKCAEYMRKWRAKNAEKNRAYMREYLKEWHARHKDMPEYKEKKKAAWTRNNKKRRQDKSEKEKESIRHKEYYQRNKDKIKARVREYNKTHRKERYEAEKRRSKSAGWALSIPLKGWTELCTLYGNICLRCFADNKPLTADHVVPFSKGGAHAIENIQPLCMSCNAEKHDKIADYRFRVPHD
jgi:5-methylcytosine-specific restriction endonuclease McrA